MPALTVLTASGIGARFGRNTVLDGVSASLRAGEGVALLGRNGCGKSTLLRVLAGVAPPGACCCGEVRGESRAYLAQQAGSDGARWDLPLSVHDVVRSGLLHRRCWRPGRGAEIHRALSDLDIADLGQRWIGELSGGQRQRVLLARAMVARPRVLLLDEPFTGLDQESIRALLEALARLRGSGVGVLCALHDQELAAGAFDRVMLLENGRLADGMPAELAPCRP